MKQFTEDEEETIFQEIEQSVEDGMRATSNFQRFERFFDKVFSVPMMERLDNLFAKHGFQEILMDPRGCGLYLKAQDRLSTA